MLAAAVIFLSIFVLVAFLAIGTITGYLVRQYFEENRPIYTTHPELWDPDTGKLIVDSNILALRVDHDSVSIINEDDDEIFD